MNEDKFKGIKEAPLSLNYYKYCYNSPLNYIDLNGKSEQKCVYDEGKSNIDIISEVRTEFSNINMSLKVCGDTLDELFKTKSEGINDVNFGDTKYIKGIFDGGIVSKKIAKYASKASDIFDTIGKSLDLIEVGVNVYADVDNNLKKGAEQEEVVVDALSEMGITLAVQGSSTAVGTLVGGAIGTAICPVIGTFVGGAVGLAVGNVLGKVLDIEMSNDKTVKENIKDVIYEDCYPGMKETNEHKAAYISEYHYVVPIAGSMH